MRFLRRYWFRFEDSGKSTPLGLGCGVTAYDYDDALGIIHKRLFMEKEVPRIAAYYEDIDISTLDENHVLPNMGLVTIRGIWFPLGYADTPSH